MNTAGEIAIVLGMLVLIAGGSTIAWVFLFLSASRTERREATSKGSARRLGEHP
ncbi:MAG TPA: hypothetical protein VI138_08455 [Candidatus Dormibacteraeota bacterium]